MVRVCVVGWQRLTNRSLVVLAEVVVDISSHQAGLAPSHLRRPSCTQVSDTPKHGKKRHTSPRLLRLRTHLPHHQHLEEVLIPLIRAGHPPATIRRTREPRSSAAAVSRLAIPPSPAPTPRQRQCLLPAAVRIGASHTVLWVGELISHFSDWNHD